MPISSASPYLSKRKNPPEAVTNPTSRNQRSWSRELPVGRLRSSSGMGGWYYDYRNGSYSGSYSDGSTTQWGYIGLESAEIAGAPYGIVVNNRFKYRIAYNLVVNQRGDIVQDGCVAMMIPGRGTSEPGDGAT